MGTNSLADRLERDEATPTVAAFPDGSVDARFRVSVGGGRVETRDTFADAVRTNGPGAFALHRKAVEPGGHAVNVATQADCLGNDATVAGFLDDHVHGDLQFETVSMGEPSWIDIYEFEDGDVLAVEASADVERWSLQTLLDALGDDAEEFLTADALCATNWTSIDGLPDALASLAATDYEGGWFLVDPGAVTNRSTAEVERFLDALGQLSHAYDVALTGNPREVSEMATALGSENDGDETLEPASDEDAAPEPASDEDAALAELRGRAGIAGVVEHGKERGAVATPDEVVAVESFDVDASRHTGGGDRFDAGLLHALARDWDWPAALRMGNACASRYVATGETGGPSELAGFLRERE